MPKLPNSDEIAEVLNCAFEAVDKCSISKLDSRVKQENLMIADRMQIAMNVFSHLMTYMYGTTFNRDEPGEGWKHGH